mgnify:CR=1 FL=1
MRSKEDIIRDFRAYMGYVGAKKEREEALKLKPDYAKTKAIRRKKKAVTITAKR